MDDKVNDFLNEINEIAPAPPQRPPPPKPEDQVWKQCYDELTGYAYYWNKKTDKVTWNPPEPLFNKGTSKPQVAKKNMYIPTLFPGVNSSRTKDIPKDIKIYSIGDGINKLPKKEPLKRPFKKESDSEDEKITLISSYGTDSESEDECIEEKKTKIEVKPSSVIPESPNLDEDNIDILAKIHKRAQELKTLGGDIPAEVKDVVESSKTALLKCKKTITGVSLVAGYSDSDEENEEIKAVLQSKDEQSQISHSTLFPITKPININDFKSPEKIENNTNVNNCDSFDNKAFQRKRRIGIALVNTTKKHSEIDNEEDVRKGLGFEQNENSNKPKDNIYQGLRIGGIAFEKSETLNPVNTTDEQKSASRLKENEDDVKNLEAINDMYSTLREKLTFLNEGRPDISPVQLMLIQAETLFMAMNDGALKLSYLQKWLKETCSELIKLEKEATPAGWMLQWDKTHKRYFYQNLTTGESKWEYPQPELSTCDDAMDISTTPPHIDTEVTNPMSPPLPPTIRSPTPPPPPIISNINPEVNFKVLDVPLPKKSVPQKSLLDSNTQPLPPGVDRHEIHTFTQPKEPEISDPLNSALDSFYSDIAAISSPPPTLPHNEDPILETNSTEIKTDMLKKKKKTKVKLAPGLVMKKKGVSKLVEKWKNLEY